MRKIQVILFLVCISVFISCGNRVENAEKLWRENKKNEAISKLKEEMLKNSDNEIAKSLLQKYQVSVWIDNSKAMWENGKKQNAIDLLSSSISTYPNNSDLKKIFNEYDRKYLSRKKSYNEIVNSPEFKKKRNTLVLSEEGFKKGFEDGMWKKVKVNFKSLGGSHSRIETHLTEKGLKYGNKIHVFNKMFYQLPQVNLKNPLNRHLVSITGITDFRPGKWNSKQVEFQWEYVFPEEIKSYGITNLINGQAYFQQYDDGWRLIKISLNDPL